jgi:RNA polymerase sigma-70 factor (ECF subfamily)
MSEHKLFQKLQSGDAMAFQKMFELHSDAVFGYAVKLLQDRPRAEDVCQEVWIQLLKSARGIEFKETLLPYLLTLTRNRCLDQLRRKKDFSFDENLDGHDIADPRPDEIEALMTTDEKTKILKACLEHLPERQRVAVTMWMSEERSYQDLTQDLACSIQTLKSLLFRAKEHLKACVEKVKI